MIFDIKKYNKPKSAVVSLLVCHLDFAPPPLLGAAECDFCSIYQTLITLKRGEIVASSQRLAHFVSQYLFTYKEKILKSVSDS